MSADSAGNLADANGLQGVNQPRPLAPHFFPPQRHLEPESDWFGVHSVCTPHHYGVLVFDGLLFNGGYGLVHVLQKQVSGFHKLETQCSVKLVGGGKPQMKPPALRPKPLGNRGEKSVGLVPDGVQNFHHAVVVVLGLPQLGHVFRRHNAFLRPSFADR